MNRIDCFLIHGIGVTLDESAYNMLVSGVRQKLAIDADVSFHPINWSPLLEKKEAAIYGWMKDLRYKALRKFACHFCCDILAYAPPKREAREGDFYFDVTKLIDSKVGLISDLYPTSKKVIIAHSLGTQIALEYVWTRPMDCLITMGSPIPYFSIRYKDFGEPPQGLKELHNFYNPCDVVSSRIDRNPKFKGISREYKVMSWLPRNWLPIHAHSFYWKSKQVHSQIAEIISEL